MKGARALSDEEIVNVFNTLKTTRDKTLLWLGVKTGLRISELLSLTLGSVMEHGKVGDWVKVEKRNTKGKIESKVLPLTDSTKKVLEEYIGTLREPNLERPLFKSEHSDKAISRMQAHRILKRAFRKLKMTGNLSTHSCRKTFAHRVHKAMGNQIEKTQVALCHKSLSSTAKYIQVNREEVENAILGLG